MNDGGMGSVKFVYDSDTLAIFGTEIASALYCDTDGVPVSITVNLDQAGRFFELDIWKVDFSPLQRFPRPQDRLTES
ncbi:MAG TPA: hypothetical protein PK765_02445 [bacterium]|nr:hypothetical protein [bacterium]